MIRSRLGFSSIALTGFVLFCFGMPRVADASLTSAGDLAFVGFNADVADAFAVVSLVDISANSIVYFDENNWNGTSFTSSEGRAVWNSGASTISAGTIIRFSNFDTTAAVDYGSVTELGAFNLNGSNEQLFAYLDASVNQTPDTFLAAISNFGFAPTTGAASTLTGTGLTVGSTAVNFTASEDIMAYTGPRSGQGTFANYLAMIGNTSNWATQDGTGDQSIDGIGPDIPFSSAAFSVVPEPATALCWGTLALFGLALGHRRGRN